MTKMYRNRKRPPARRPSTKNPKRRFLVFCEGKVTEPDYIKGFAARVRTASVEISKEQGVPWTLVREAKKRKAMAQREAQSTNDKFLEYDEVWCVFDIDDHPNLNDAFQMARDNGIKLAVSNPCFELWLLLHFRENPGQQNRKAVLKLLRKYIPKYDKHIDFACLENGVNDASKRAERLEREAAKAGESGENPSTRVYLLTNSILENRS
ncbi:RloB family protein [bacterium]|nr:RloB family protein [bacterium]